MFVVDQRLFWNCCSLICVDIPSRWGLLIRKIKLEIWCWSWIFQILCTLYKNGLSIELFRIEWAKWDLCLTTVKYLAKMLLHIEWAKQYYVVDILM